MNSNLITAIHVGVLVLVLVSDVERAVVMVLIQVQVLELASVFVGLVLVPVLVELEVLAHVVNPYLAQESNHTGSPYKEASFGSWSGVD